MNRCTAQEPENRPTAGQAIAELDVIMKEMGIQGETSISEDVGGVTLPEAQYQRVKGALDA